MTKVNDIDYQALSVELETLMADLQRDDLGVDEALKCYERGLIIIKELEDYLSGAENKVTELKARFSKT